ncbi:MAG: class II aldolase/adducin family protein [Candidatus Woesearchaeota archaeon]|nr:class II aldolase/adducin family protein [Candidatus Woesearchaeota archaeon]
MPNQTKDQRTFTVLPASLDTAVFEALRDRYVPSMATIGEQLGKMRALPLQEEPADSGNWVTSGNYSIRCREPDAPTGFFITASGVNKTELEKDGVLFVERIDYDAGIIYAHGTASPSRETLVHDLAYQEFSDVTVVLHTHDRVALRYGTAPKTPQPIFFANRHEAEQVVEALADVGYVNIPEHGQFMVGRTIYEALARAREHHEQATLRTPLHRAIDAAIPTCMALYAVCALWASILEVRHLRQQTKDCQTSGNLASITYTCDTPRTIRLNKAYGDSMEQRPDGKYEYTINVPPPT